MRSKPRVRVGTRLTWNIILLIMFHVSAHSKCSMFNLAWVWLSFWLWGLYNLCMSGFTQFYKSWSFVLQDNESQDFCENISMCSVSGNCVNAVKVNNFFPNPAYEIILFCQTRFVPLLWVKKSGIKQKQVLHIEWLCAVSCVAAALRNIT